MKKVKVAPDGSLWAATLTIKSIPPIVPTGSSWLHRAISQDLKAGTDGDCLRSATAVRIVLEGLSERIADALRDETELNQAADRLLRKPGNDTQ